MQMFGITLDADKNARLIRCYSLEHSVFAKMNEAVTSYLALEFTKYYANECLTDSSKNYTRSRLFNYLAYAHARPLMYFKELNNLKILVAKLSWSSGKSREYIYEILVRSYFIGWSKELKEILIASYGKNYSKVLDNFKRRAIIFGKTSF